MRRPPDGDSSTPNINMTPYAPPAHTLPTGPYGVHPPAPIPSARGVPTAAGLLHALTRRWVLASFLGLLVGLALAAGVWMASPTGRHSVRALLEMYPDQGVLDRNAYDNNFENWKKSQEVLIKTRGLLTRVVKSKPVAELSVLAGEDDPAKWVEEQLILKWPAPDVLSVSLNGDNPEQLKQILDALVTEYAKDANEAHRRDRTGRIKMLEAVLTEANDEIKRIELDINLLSKEGLTIGSEGNAALIARLQAQLADYDRRINDLERSVKEGGVKAREVERRLKGVDATPVPPAVVNAEPDKNVAVEALKIELDMQEEGFKELADRLEDPKSPLIARKKQQVLEARQKYETARNAERGALEQRLRAENKQKVQDELAALSQGVTVNKGVLAELNTLRQDLEDRTKRLATRGNVVTDGHEKLKPLREHRSHIQNKIIELKAAANPGGRVQVREEANVIINYNLKQKVMVAAAVAVLGFVGVMVLVAYLEWRSRRVGGVGQVVGELGMRVIGTIPAFPSRASLKAGEADQDQNWRLVLNESVNSTRTMLLHTARTQNMQVLMVTSAMQGEGKTSLSSQLATSMATAGLRTLILDCDLRNPSMHRLFDVALSPGCSEILCQEVDVSDAVQPTTVPNLWMIPAGQCSNRVITALAQGHPLETLFNRLRGQFDFIVVDCCPVLPVADALLVGQHVDGAVISILQDISQLPKVLNASERLTQLNIPLLGAVVNGIKTDVHAYGYNYVKQLPA